MLLRQAIKHCINSTPFISEHIGSRVYFHRPDSEEQNQDTYINIVYGDSIQNDEKNSELDFICFPVSLELNVPDCDKEFGNFLARKIAQALHRLQRKQFKNDVGEEVVRNGVFTHAYISSPLYDDDVCRFIYGINFDAQEPFCCEGEMKQQCEQHSKQ